MAEAIKTNLENLNSQQRKAVKSDAGRILVLAGAGAGKTKTLLQKLIYLIEEKSVSPANILTVTFSKNAANEIIDRLIISSDSTGKYNEIITDKQTTELRKEQERNIFKQKYNWINNLTIKTFHALCYHLLRSDGVNEFDNRFKIVTDTKNETDEFYKSSAKETIYEIFNKVLMEACEDNDYIIKLKRYILDYFVDRIHTSKPALTHDGKFYTSLNGTKVRSKSEQYIADWLYRHNIPFQYEPDLNIKDFPFHPDFYIPAANLYIEHISNKSHNTVEKEEQFKKGNLLLVKTFESMTKDSTLFNRSLDRIIKERLPEDFQRRITLSFQEEFNGYFKEIKEFVTQVVRITDMIKVENLSIDRVSEKAQKDPHERVRLFYELAIPLIKEYNKYCINKSYLDYNDLMLRSISLFKNQEDIAGKYRNKYDYILIDEFQDVNNLQVELIKLLLKKQTQLFCVGDDWQSIYGFRGSNVSYIISFEKHFPKAEIIKLDLNYRSTQHIVGASNEVIKHNKFKIDKNIRASKKSEHKIVVFAGKDIEENLQYVISEVKRFIKEGIPPEEILFLYRRTKMYHPYYLAFRNAGIRVQAKTIHAAKGLEAKVVFIIGLTEGYGGFPDIWLEDRIFQMIRKANHDLLLEEERRLFYVALTRAKEKLYLITEKGNESSFIKEIPTVFTVKTGIPVSPVIEKPPSCPNCFSQLEKMFKYCPYCGYEMNSTTVEKGKFRR